MSKKYSDRDLVYAAGQRCACGAGMAHPREININGAWMCSDILTGRAIPAGQPGAVEHTPELPFAFWETTSELQTSAMGASTRPEGSLPVLTAEQLANRLTPGDILCTHFPGSSFLAKGIAIGQSLAGGETAIFGHAMRFIGGGQVISQEWKVTQKKLSDWTGQVICRLHNPRYSTDDNNQLVWYSSAAIDRWYDGVGMAIGQGLRGLLSRIPKIGLALGNAAASFFQIPWLTYCSEMVAENQRRVDPGFMAETPKPAPDEMVKWCKCDGWLLEVYEVEE